MMWKEELARNRLAARRIMGTALVLKETPAADRAYTGWMQTLENIPISQRAGQEGTGKGNSVYAGQMVFSHPGGGENLWGEWRRLKDLSDALEYDTLRYSRFFDEQGE